MRMYENFRLGRGFDEILVKVWEECYLNNVVCIIVDLNFFIILKSYYI